MQQTKRVPLWTNSINAIVPKFAYAGTHVVADFWNGRIIESAAEIETLLRGAAAAANSTPLQVSIHTFAPEGITGIVLLAESHISIHTWPEINYIAVDVFTCGKDATPKKAIEFLKEALQPKKVKVQELKRGIHA
ncbi:adenosylmethionine decarboxylase [Patescibacteria group bacterium]|nr:adenosylmethionine decarboxylase [Patescibacteria group bacterium]